MRFPIPPLPAGYHPTDVAPISKTHRMLRGGFVLFRRSTARSTRTFVEKRVTTDIDTRA